jgi:hypothetical protein
LTYDTARIAQRIKELQPKASNRQIAKTIGVGSRTIDRDTAPNGADNQKNNKKNNEADRDSAPNGAAPLTGACIAPPAKMVPRHQKRAHQGLKMVPRHH